MQILVEVVLCATGTAKFQLSQEALEVGNDDQNEDEFEFDVHALSKYAKWTYFIGNALRIVLLFISFKKRAVCKTYFSLSLAMLIVNECIVAKEFD